MCFCQNGSVLGVVVDVRPDVRTVRKASYCGKWFMTGDSSDTDLLSAPVFDIDWHQA